MGPKPFNARKLRKDLRTLVRPQLYETSFLGMGIMAGPTCRPSCTPPTSVKSFFHAAWRVAFHVLDLITYRRGMQLVNGPALIARLVKSADDARRPDVGRLPGDRPDSPTRTAPSPAPSLQHPDGPVTVRGPRACCWPPAASRTTSTGGAELFPRTPTGQEHWTLAPPETTGDGITLGEQVGGQLDTSLASPAAWCPVSLVNYRNGRVGTYPHIVDRGKPGLIAVTANGKRFVNEADGYYQFTTGMIDAAPEGEPVQAWLICDHAFQRRYPFGMSKPFPVPTLPYLRSGYLKRGKTLARSGGRSAASTRPALEQTVAEFNRHARVGEDPEFGRGRTAFNRASGRQGPRPEPVAGPAGEGSVLRDQGAARQLRHVLRAACRRRRPGA